MLQRPVVEKKKAVVKIQTYLRSFLEMRRQRLCYLQLKEATLTIQRYRRADNPELQVVQKKDAHNKIL